MYCYNFLRIIADICPALMEWPGTLLRALHGISFNPHIIPRSCYCCVCQLSITGKIPKKDNLKQGRFILSCGVRGFCLWLAGAYCFSARSETKQHGRWGGRKVLSSWPQWSRQSQRGRGWGPCTPSKGTHSLSPEELLELQRMLLTLMCLKDTNELGTRRQGTVGQVQKGPKYWK